MSNKFLYYGHQRKGDAYLKALMDRHWTPTRFSQTEDIRFCLTHIDVNARAETIRRLHEKGVPTFKYPHSGFPEILADMPDHKPCELVKAHFVISEHHANVMKTYGYPIPCVPVGWSLSEIRPFQSRGQVTNVLFAPIHCTPQLWLSNLDKDINRRTYKILLGMAHKGQIKLTIRYLYNLRACGIEFHPEHANYIKGNPDNSTVEMEKADLVVGHHTFAYIAVAMGIPTVMMAESLAPRLSLGNGKYYHSMLWHKYREMVMYPLDILSVNNVDALFARAISSDVDIVDWRERMIGKPFDGGLFYETLKGLL